MQSNNKEDFKERKELILSVIVPLGQNEDISSLVEDLKALPENSEVIFSTSEDTAYYNLNVWIPGVDVRFINANSGRAQCMNAGARVAKGSHLLFLHADSHLEEKSVEALVNSIKLDPKALLYFDLAFKQGSFLLMKINEFGAYFRCRVLHTPFGDQGFCMGKKVFERLGGFPTYAPYGEDHLLVRNAIRQKVPIKPIKAPLYTSARKYEKHGWLKTTANHLYLWRKQAFQDYMKHRGISNESGNY